jgi:hypothetical protein
MKLDSDDTLSDLYKIVEFFRNNRRLSNAQKGLAIYGAFPTSFKGQSIDKNESKKKNPCLCGEIHRYKDCPYLMESARTKDWKSNPNIQKKIDKMLWKYPNLKTILITYRSSNRMSHQNRIPDNRVNSKRESYMEHSLLQHTRPHPTP